MRPLRDADADVVDNAVAEERLAVDRVEVRGRRDHAADPRVATAERIDLTLDERVRLLPRLASRECIRELLRDRRELDARPDRLCHRADDPLLHGGGRLRRIHLRRYAREYLGDEDLAAPGDLVAEDHADAEVRRRARRDVRAMPRTVHQALVRLAHTVCASDVLEHDRGPDLRRAHAITGRTRGGRDVRHVLRAPHLLRVPARDGRDLVVPDQRGQPGGLAIAVDQCEQPSLRVVGGRHRRIVGRGIHRQRYRRLAAAPHRKIREHRGPVDVARRDLHLLSARVRSARDLRDEPAGMPGLEIEPLRRAAIVGDEHLGIFELRIHHRVDLERAIRRQCARDRGGRDARALQREHDGAAPIRASLRRADTEPCGRAVLQELREVRL